VRVCGVCLDPQHKSTVLL